MKTWKKVLAMVLALSMVIPGVYLGKPGSEKVQAASEAAEDAVDKVYAEEYTAEEAKAYIGKDTPTAKASDKSGWLFAGWFASENCTLDDAISTVREASGTVYAKFVPADVLSVKAQSTPAEKGAVLRFVSSVESLNYSKVGFEVKYTDSENQPQTKNNTTKTVYERIKSSTEGAEFEFSPMIMDTESKYFITAKLDTAQFDDMNQATDFTVSAYWYTLDNVQVKGASRCVSLQDGWENAPTINMSFALKENVTADEVEIGDTLNVDVDGLESVATVIGIDNSTVHVRVDKVNLKSATRVKFTTSDGKEVGETVYRNLYTTYTGDGVGDTSWYEVYKEVYGDTKKEFIIATSADLYGLSTYSQNHTFSGETIYVVSDIEVNKGNASEWGENPPKHSWKMIGKAGNNGDDAFAGIFDGQGHTISGLYYDGAKYGSKNGRSGFFNATKDGSVIRNLRLADSYFTNTSTVSDTSRAVGGIAVYGGGIFDTIYVEESVTIKNNNTLTGGIIGQSSSTYGQVTVQNCWVEADISTTTSGKGIGGILGEAQNKDAIVNINNCLFTGTLRYGTRGNTSVYLGGILGWASNNASVKIQNSLNAGTIVGTGATYVCTVVGLAASGTTITINNVYADSGMNAKTCDGKGTIVGEESITQTTIRDTQGLDACLNVRTLPCDNDGLVRREDEDCKWVFVEETFPMLKSFINVYDYTPIDFTQFVTGETPIDLSEAWYDEGETNLIIANGIELYEFAIASKTDNFDGKTITLENNITFNVGNAEDWADAAPAYTWTPIGTSGSRFAGTFNGRGHTISGLYKADGTGIGLFGEIDGAKIQNLRLENSYFANTTDTGNVHIGGIAGQGSGTFSTIYSNVILESKGARIGGILGYTRNGGAGATITNCWFAGTITLTGGKQAGGIIGLAWDDVTITACLNTGAINGTGGSGVGGIVGNPGDDAVVTIKNSLNVGKVTNGTQKQTGSVIGTIGASAQANVDGVYATTDSHLNGTGTVNGILDGEVEQVAENKLIGENATTNASGLFGVNNWVTRAISTPMLRSFHWYYANENATEFTIQDVAELYDFAAISKTDNFADKTVYLGADITDNEGNASNWAEGTGTKGLQTWTRIGVSNAFEGTFDGQGHTISGLYGVNTTGRWGLFYGTAGTSTVKNLKLTNSYFENNGKSENTTRPCAGIAAYGGGTFDTIYVGADVIIKNTASGTAGIVGNNTNAYGKATIKNCWVAGDISMPSTAGRYVGGIFGNAQDDVTIENCLFTGTLSYKDKESDAPIGLGGLIATSGQGDKCLPTITIRNSLSAGIINGKNGTQVGAALGYLNNGALIVENVYTDADIYSVVFNENKNNESSITTTGSFTKVDHANLIGENAKTNTELDFANYWVTQPNRSPILKSFSDFGN